jgi:hypothetical protein
MGFPVHLDLLVLLALPGLEEHQEPVAHQVPAVQLELQVHQDLLVLPVLLVLLGLEEPQEPQEPQEPLDRLEPLDRPELAG